MAVGGVSQRQASGMKRLTGKAPEHFYQFRWGASGYPRPAAILGIADQRMVDVGQMHSDLVGAARLELHGEQGMMGKTLGDAIVGNRRLAAGCHHRHFFAGTRVPADGRVHGAAPRQETRANGSVFALDRPGLKLIHETCVSAQGARRHHQSRCILVQPMHYPGSRQRGKLRVDM